MGVGAKTTKSPHVGRTNECGVDVHTNAVAVAKAGCNVVVVDKRDEITELDVHMDEPAAAGRNKRREVEGKCEELDNKKRKMEAPTILYTKEHSGDIFALVDTSAAEKVKNKSVRNGLYFVEKTKDIKSDEFDKIKSITAIGITLYKIGFETIEAANAFVLNEKLWEKGMKPFIPRNFVETYGVIRDVPTDWSDEFIMSGITSSKKVSSVRRFTRYNPENQNERINTETVKICFYGDEHPKWVILEKTVLVVKTYYPAVRQCHNCGRLGHTKNGCRSGKRCIKCGVKECVGECTVVKCILCHHEGHISTDKSACTKWQKEVNLNQIMTEKKMYKKEVLQTYNMNNRFELLWNNEEFPNLPERGDRTSNNKNDKVNRILTPFTYSSVTKKPKKIMYILRVSRKIQECLKSLVHLNLYFPQKVKELRNLKRLLLKF